MAKLHAPVAAVIGAVGAAVLAALWRDQADTHANCVPDTIGACFGYPVPILIVGPAVVPAVVWLALRATDARRALPAAVLGALTTAGAVLLQQATEPRWLPPSPWLAALLAAVGFGVGTLVVTARWPVPLQVGLALLLLAPLAAFEPLRRETRRDDRSAAFARVGLPLLVPTVPGYRVGFADADLSDRVLSVTLTRQRQWISVHVLPLPADFAPPQRCGPTTAAVVLRRESPQPSTPLPCRQVGPDHWTRAEAGGEVHLVRRGDALVLVSPGTDVPPTDTATAAATLTEVSAGRLAELSVG
ncbi:hypothetical protein [Micromonospora sp. NPDC023956]|uniref:hypothetical protein n=1 Tax=Micromonospora sp. NPDC023956 TaxID=3155722 RepID=UPI0033D7C6C0